MVERPLDCHDCKREVAVQYTEIVGERMTRTVMCAQCPHLEKHLYGTRMAQGVEGVVVQTSVVCAHCQTTLEAVRMGDMLGCKECYNTFADIVIDELLREKRISRHFTANARTQPLHLGRVPGEVSKISPTLRLIALNEALDETVIREDYEQAALLRDQIEKLKLTGDHDERQP